MCFLCSFLSNNVDHSDNINIVSVLRQAPSPGSRPGDDDVEKKKSKKSDRK